jgi:hypothetical protein
MTLPARFSLLHSEFNGFLYASIGDEGEEPPLSVFSALTRLGLDPWQEAARLSTLPKAVASQALAATIARLPTGARDAAGAEGVAARLIEFLPRGGTASGLIRRTPAASRRAPRRAMPPIWLCAALATAVVAVAWIATHFWLT